MDKQNQGVQLINADQTEEDKRKTAQNAALSSMSSSTFVPGGTRQAVAPGAGPSTSSTARAQQAAGSPRGSGFTGIGKYLQANVGSGLGRAVSSQISGVGEQARAGLGQAIGQFQTDLSGAQQQLGQAQAGFQTGFSGIMQGTSPYIQEQTPATLGQQPPSAGMIRTYQAPAVNQPITTEQKVSAPQMAPGASITPSAPVSPVTPVPSTTIDPAQAYQRLVQGQITAPTGLGDISAIQSKALEAQQMAEATRTAGGRAALLQQQFGRGGRAYTSGQTALDALLLGQAGSQLAAARKEAAGVGRQITSQEKTAEEQSKELQSQAQIAGQEAKSAVEGTQSTLSGAISDQQRAYKGELDRLATKLKREISSGTLSQESAKLLKGLGFDPTTTQLYGLKKEEIANLIAERAPIDITQATSATLGQLQKINALRKLSGQAVQFTPEDLARAGQTAGKEAAMSGIGTTEDLSEKAKAAKSEYEKILGSLIPGYAGYGTSDNRAYSTQDQEVTGQTGERMSEYKNFWKPFIYEQNQKRGKLYYAGKLANALASGQLYNEQTGKLNVDLANQLKDFWSWRHYLSGTRGGFAGIGGAGEYSSYAGDDARIAALNKLISEANEGLKVAE